MEKQCREDRKWAWNKLRYDLNRKWNVNEYRIESRDNYEWFIKGKVAQWKKHNNNNPNEILSVLEKLVWITIGTRRTQKIALKSLSSSDIMLT